jgi:hypothetical protein
MAVINGPMANGGNYTSSTLYFLMTELQTLFPFTGNFKLQLNERPWSAFCQETCRAFEIVQKAFPFTLSPDNNNLRTESRDVFVDVSVSLLRFKFRADDIKHFQFPSALFARPCGLSLWSQSNITSKKVLTEFITLNGLSFMTLELR